MRRFGVNSSSIKKKKKPKDFSFYKSMIWKNYFQNFRKEVEKFVNKSTDKTTEE